MYVCTYIHLLTFPLDVIDVISLKSKKHNFAYSIRQYESQIIKLFIKSTKKSVSDNQYDTSHEDFLLVTHGSCKYLHRFVENLIPP